MQEQPQQPSFFTQPPSSPEPSNAPAPKSPFSSIKKKHIIISGSILLALIVVIVGSLIWRGASQTAVASTPYDFREPQAIESGSTELTIPMEKLSEDAFSFDKDLSEQPVRLFADKGLTQQINSGEYMAIHDQKKKEVVLMPRGGESRFYNPDTRENVEVGSASVRHQWNYRDTYYVVQYVDSKSGKELERPIVYPYTMNRSLESPRVASSVDAQGHVELQWDKVDGAEKYYVVKFETDGGILLGETEANTTTWSSAKFDEPNVRVQNEYFSNGVVTEDEARAKGYVGDPYDADKGEIPTYEIAVMAIKGNDHSSLGTTNIRDLLSSIPYESASNATREIPAFTDLTLKTINDIPTSLPFTVASGRTVSQPLIIDTTVKESRAVNIQGRGMVNTLRVKATIKGTALSRYFQIEQYDPANIDASLAAIAKRNEEAQLKTGALTAYTYTTASGALDLAKASKGRPQVDYPVFASNDTADYIAANIIKGNEFIDMSAYDKPDSIVSVNDATLEAINQNPYIMYVENFRYHAKEKILSIEFTESKDRLAENQKKVQTEAKRIVADVTNGSMSQRQKVEAINKYIVDSVEYDYVALAAKDNIVEVTKYKDAWNAYGALFEKKVVCAGYAMLFSTLAREAGLDTVYVNGYVGDTSLHAWNMVKVDNKWVVVDTTWNDSSAEPNKYLGISLETAKQQRTQTETANWMSDIYRAQYLN